MIEWLRRPAVRSCCGATWAAWARRGTRRCSSARRIATRAIRRRPKGPTCPSESFRPITTPTNCSASRRPTPARSRCWTRAWARWATFSTVCPGSDETLLTLTSSRGFPLGEHGRVGPCDGALFGELVHVPWMIRLPDAAGAALRSRTGRAGRPLGDLAGLVGPGHPPLARFGRGAGGGTPDVRAVSPTAESLLRLARGQSGARPRSALYRRRRGPAGDPHARLVSPRRRRARTVRQAGRPLGDQQRRLPLPGRGRGSAGGAGAATKRPLPAGRISDLPPLSDVLLSGLE